MRTLFFAVLSAILSVTFLFCSVSLAQCGTHVWTEIEMKEQPCVRVYRTIYPSDYLCCGVFGVPVRNFHYWSYDLSHVYWIPPAALFPAVPGHEKEIEKEFNLPCYPGEVKEEADRVPELKPQEETNEYDGEIKEF